MNDDLAKRLRYCSEEQNGCGMCALSSDCVLRVGLLTQAADAIEELSAHYCPHAIRNVHDRGDDSLCRVLGAEPPKEERMNEVRINLNEVIKVKLTDLGKDIYYHQYDELNRRRGRIVCEPSFPKEDAEGYTKFQLWNFMELYGEHIGMAKPNVIEPLEIVCELPKEEA